MKKNIYLIDLTHESPLGLGSDMMPIQLGLIASYCLKEHGDKVDIKIVKFISELDEMLRSFPPFIVASSNYLWNIDLSYKVVSSIKKSYPDAITVFGGPNYPVEKERQVEWLKSHPNVDFYIYGDGEEPFSALTGFLLKDPDITRAKKALLPSCHSLIDGKAYFAPTAGRIEDLTAIPSPYTTGLMDKFFEHKLIPMVQSNRGCPFTCTFCVEGGPYYSKVCKASLERKKSEIDYIASKVKYTNTLRITDSNFGMFPEDVDLCTYIGDMQKRIGYPAYLGCSAGKNAKDRILKCNELVGGAMRLTASVQSLDPVVIKNIKRENISLKTIMDLSDQVSDTDTHSYSEIILALPGATLESEISSIKGLMDAGISNITQHQLSIIYGTEIGSLESIKKYGIKTMFRPAQRCVGHYSFNSEKFDSIETEEIAVSTNTLSFKDYLAARRMYLTVGLFYNDRIFGEIHALLRLLRLSTWEWMSLIHGNIDGSDKDIKALYDGFMRETEGELWRSREELIKDVSANLDRYASGEAGGNLIYKYRSRALVHYFDKLHKIAFTYLKEFLKSKGLECGSIVKDIEDFSLFQKSNILDMDFQIVHTFDHDVLKMIKDHSFYRASAGLDDIRRKTRMRIAHTGEQKDIMKRQLEFYGRDQGGLTMLISRFPIKRFYRKAEIV